jgi:alkylation response protein AidB-like acyl-CoA dehydrogenase
MATRLYVADSMAYRTAGLLDAAVGEVPASGPEHDAGLQRVLEEYTVECSALKVFGTECLDFVADEALQILGGYGFLRDYPIERHYRDSRINRIFEGTNEVNRLIIPATLLKRAGKGQLAYFQFVETVQREIASGRMPDAPGDAPLAADALVVEQSKRVTAWAAHLLVSRNLKDLAERQQHLEILANMVIDLFAAESAVARTRKLLGRRGAASVANHLDLTRVFVASANERIADGARRLAANELAGQELDAALAVIDRLQVRLPIVTIAAKTRIAERIVAGDQAVTENI